MSDGRMNSVSVVIVTWNSAIHIGGCITSVIDASEEVLGPLYIVVVDNKSSDDTLQVVESEFSDVRRVQTHRNMGFGAAANIGISQATGDAVLVLNPDATLESGALGAMLCHLRDDSGLGCVAPMQRGPAGSTIFPGRRFPSLLAAMADGTIIQRFLPDMTALRRYYMVGEHSSEPEWLIGACLCFRRDALVTIGGFDVGYEMYSEELDLLRALALTGWRCAVTTDAHIFHQGSASADQDPVAREQRFFRSRYRYVAKTWGMPAAVFLRVFVATTGVLRCGEQLLRMCRPSQRKSAVSEIRQIVAVTTWQWFGWRR